MGFFFNIYLNSRRWYVLCLVFIPYLVLVQVSGDIDWDQLNRVYLKMETGSRLQNVLNKKTGRWIMSRNIIFALMYHRHKLVHPNYIVIVIC
jgi:hypothetical protein